MAYVARTVLSILNISDLIHVLKSASLNCEVQYFPCSPLLSKKLRIQFVQKNYSGECGKWLI